MQRTIQKTNTSYSRFSFRSNYYPSIPETYKNYMLVPVLPTLYSLTISYNNNNIYQSLVSLTTDIITHQLIHDDKTIYPKMF